MAPVILYQGCSLSESYISPSLHAFRPIGRLRCEAEWRERAKRLLSLRVEGTCIGQHPAMSTITVAPHPLDFALLTFLCTLLDILLRAGKSSSLWREGTTSRRQRFVEPPLTSMVTWSRGLLVFRVAVHTLKKPWRRCLLAPLIKDRNRSSLTRHLPLWPFFNRVAGGLRQRRHSSGSVGLSFSTPISYTYTETV
jgi:hypothetical protein